MVAKYFVDACDEIFIERKNREDEFLSSLNVVKCLKTFLLSWFLKLKWKNLFQSTKNLLLSNKKRFRKQKRNFHKSAKKYFFKVEEFKLLNHETNRSM